jgi:hypothetical protein
MVRASTDLPRFCFLLAEGASTLFLLIFIYLCITSRFGAHFHGVRSLAYGVYLAYMGYDDT